MKKSEFKIYTNKRVSFDGKPYIEVHVCNSYVRHNRKSFNMQIGSTYPTGTNMSEKELYALADKVLKAKQGIGPMPTRKTRNLLNPSAGEFDIPFDTPACCDPGSEVYHSM